MHTASLLVGLTASIVTVAAQYDQATSTAALVAEESTGTQAAVTTADPTPYIVPNTATDIYLKTTAQELWNTPPCSTTASTATETVPCPTLWFGRKVKTSTGSSSIATATYTGAAVPLRVPKAFDGIAKLLGLKKKSKQPERMTAPAQYVEYSFLQERDLGALITPLNKLATQVGETTLSAGNAEPNPHRQYALGLGSGNYDQLVAQSIAAVQKGGAAGLASMWASYISEGNQYATYYASNGHGNARKGLLNELALSNGDLADGIGIVSTLTADAIASVSTLTNTDLANAGWDILSIMGQIDGTTYGMSPTIGASSSSTKTSSTTSTSATSSSTKKSSSTKSKTKSSTTKSKTKSTTASSARTSSTTTS